MLSKLSEIANGFGIGRLLALALLIAFLSLRVADPPQLAAFRLQVFDIYQSLLPRERSPQPVAIVDIDEVSLDRVGQWPWPRTVVAQLVHRMQKAGIVAVAFDVLFAEPDRMSPAVVAGTMTRLTPETRKELERLPSNDDRLAAVFKRGLVVVGEAALPNKAEQSVHTEPPPASPVATKGIDPAPYLPRFAGLLRNLPVLENAAKGKGAITILPERDAIIRRVPAVVIADGVYRASLGLEMLRVATGGRAMLIKTNEAGVSGVVVGGVDIPTDSNGRIWVRFTEFGSRPDYIPAHEILDGTVDPARLQGRLVFIGTSATGLLDIKTTPLDPAMPGVEVHAQLVETILSKAHLTRPNYALGAELSVAAVLSLGLIFLLPLAGALASLLAGAALSLGVAGASWYLYSQFGYLFDIAYPLATAFIVFCVLIFYNYYDEERQRRRIRGAFQQYLSPDLVEQLAQNSDSLVLGGESRNMTIMFSDVRGFTTISETFKEDPQGLTSLMNRFLTPLSNAIMELNGTIDKYMGDAIMAFWNAPLDDPDHCRAACFAALEMHTRIETVNSERREEAEQTGTEFIPLNIGVGLNTGLCVVGNMGSDSRFDYSVLGDSVNLASRLEGQSKNYGVKTVIGQSTADAVSEEFAVIELDLIRVKGKLEPENVFALLGTYDVAIQDGFVALRENNEKMLAAYRGQNWSEARAALEVCRQHAGTYDVQGLYDLYEARIGELKADPPGEDWDGVFVATSK
ncbi:MAG: adenylate/guanylate cyclase domain-containing protein [Pseudomonadota bacterium]